MDDCRKTLLEQINRKLAVIEEILDCKDCIYVLEARESLNKLVDTYEEDINDYDENFVHKDEIADYVNDYPAITDYP